VPDPSLRRAFLIFHLTLGPAVLFESIRTFLAASGAAGHDPHLALLAGVEAIGAALFLIPRTLKVGGVVMLLTFAIAVVMHSARGHVPAALLVYATGVFFVMVHGSAWHPKARSTAAAA
jgi:hypothetical protein